jgi:Tfp pilus assembly protein PilF
MENYKKSSSSSASHKQAIEFYSRKLKENSEMPRYNHMMAALKIKERDPESATKYYETAIKCDPNNIAVRNDYSLLLNEKGNKIGAINEMRTALKIQDDNALLRNNLGAMLSRHGDYKEGVTHAKQAVQLNPNSALNHRNLAKIYNARSELELALEHNKIAIQLEGNQGVLQPDTRSYRAAAVQIIGNISSASGNFVQPFGYIVLLMAESSMCACALPIKLSDQIARAQGHILDSAINKFKY